MIDPKKIVSLTSNNFQSGREQRNAQLLYDMKRARTVESTGYPGVILRS